MRVCTHESKHFLERSLFAFCSGYDCMLFCQLFSGCPVCVYAYVCMCACRCVCRCMCVWGVVVVVYAIV